MVRAGEKVLRHHPALALTLGYLFLTGVGMVYEWLFFKNFDLQIFNYAEPSDFLLVALREPLLLVFTVISVLVLVNFTNKHSKRIEKVGTYRRLYLWLIGKSWGRAVERLAYLVLVIGYFISLTSIYADYTAKLVHRGQGSKVRVELTYQDSSKPGEPGGKIYILLGSTSKYLLAYDPVAKSTQVLPANNIARLTAERQ